MREGEPSFEQEKNPREKLAEEVKELIAREGLVFDEETQRHIQKESVDSDRYIRAVGDRSGERVFLKIPINDNPEVDAPFRRTVEMAKFLKTKSDFKTRGVISSNIDRDKGTPYAIMESLPDAKIGFTSTQEDIELFTPTIAENCIKELGKLQDIDPKTFPPELRDSLVKIDFDAKSLEQEILDSMEEKVNPEDTGKEELYHEVLNRRLKTDDFKKRVVELLDHFREVIADEDNKGEFLFHGDLDPHNMYVYDDESVELLDLEWSGLCKNEAVGAIIDFGNLRARAWNNKEFREALDKAMLKRYKSKGKEELGKAIVSIGILRSHMGLAGFFQN